MLGCRSREGTELLNLGAQRQTLFQIGTLRRLLLHGYAIATMGTVAGYTAIGAFVGAALFLLLALLRFRHARRSRAPQAAAGRPTVVSRRVVRCGDPS